MRIGLARRGYSPTGGAEAYLRRFADAAAAAGHEIVLYTESWPGEAWPYRLVHTTSRSPKGFADALLVAQPQAVCDILFSLERVWTCDAYRAGDGVHAAWLATRRQYEAGWKGWLRQASPKHREMLALEKALFSKSGARLVIANSWMIREEIIAQFGYPAEQIEVIHNGLPPLEMPHGLRETARRELGLKEADYALLFAGSGWERKGLRFALEAVNRLRNVTLLVAGKGRPGAFPNCPQARFLGPVSDMKPFLAAADAFVLPTIYEPFSNACLEALAAGLPVITTACNGFAEIIESGAEGEILAEPGDVSALADAIDRWRDPVRREAIRERLVALGRRYTIEENARRTLALIERLPKEAPI